MVAAGRFRQDLLFRLDVLQCGAAAARTHRGHLQLAKVFLARACAQTGRSKAG